MAEEAIAQVSHQNYDKQTRGVGMNLLKAYFVGSILNPENKKALDFARERLQPIKDEKLWARHEKNNDKRHRGTAYVENIFKHLKEEVAELGEGLRKDDFDNAIEEIADIINCAEILAASLFLSTQDI